MESLFASINPTALKGEALMQAVSQALRVAAALSSPSLSVWRSTYVGLTQLFGRLEAERQGDSLGGADSEAHLRKLLFSLDPGSSEALRLQGAGAIVALVKASPRQALVFNADVLTLREAGSKAVREALAPASTPQGDRADPREGHV